MTRARYTQVNLCVSPSLFVEQMKTETLGAAIKKHLDLDGDFFKQYLKEFAESATGELKVFHVNDYSGI